MQDVVGIIASFGLILLALLLGELLRRARVPAHTTRKAIHIAVSHWWLIAWYFHDSMAPALVGPVVFVIVNFASYRGQLLPAMETTGSGPGTVYYPMSLIVLVVLCFGGHIPIAVGAIGVFTMGWGDGLAALIGRSIGGPRVELGGRVRTVGGTLAMFAASTAVAYIFTLVLFNEGGVTAGVSGWNPADSSLFAAGGEAAGQALPAGWAAVAAFGTGAFATAVEFFTPGGVDNLSVPILTTLFYAATFL